MLDLPLQPYLYLLLAGHCIIGAIAAIIAQRKGYKLLTWVILGLIGGTAALVAALIIKRQN